MNEIRDRLNELEVAHPINPTEAGRASFFNRNGFSLFRSNCGYARSPADQNLVQRLRDAFELTDFQTIVNQVFPRTRTNRARAERRQLLTKILQDDYRDYFFDDEFCDFLKRSEDRVLTYARDMLPIHHELLTTETVLSSKSGSMTIQDPHCDLSSTYVGKALLAFIAIQPNTTIILYPGSHRIHERLLQEYLPRRYSLEPGDILLFHPRLIHCGDRYPESNIRLHYYIFAQPRLRWRDITFPVRDGEIALMQATKESMQNRENRIVGAEDARERVRRRTERFLAEVRPKRGYTLRR